MDEFTCLVGGERWNVVLTQQAAGDWKTVLTEVHPDGTPIGSPVLETTASDEEKDLMEECDPDVLHELLRRARAS